MRKEQLQKLIENELSGIAYDIGFNILDCLEDGQDIDQWDFEDMVMEELDSWFTYYDDAWEFLQDNDITDFSEAFREWNVTDVCGIACYYAREMICADVNDYWNDYELEELDEEDDDIEI